MNFSSAQLEEITASYVEFQLLGKDEDNSALPIDVPLTKWPAVGT